MKWSRYNYLYQSPKYGYFLYNSRTNSFMNLEYEIYEILSKYSKLQGEDLDITIFNEEDVETLINAKVLVNNFDDDNYISQKKFLKYNANFNNQTLGLVIVPTCACNFACPYCYEHNLPNNVMSKETVDNLIKFIKSFKESKYLNICWHGGEPLMGYESMKRFLIKIKESSINLTSHSMVSNGYLFNEEKCYFLKEHNLSCVQITIDGTPEIHNKSRYHKSGKPTYDIIVNNIEMIFRLIPDCHIIIRMNIHEENKDKVPALYHELRKRWKGQNFSIYLTFAVDHGECKVACMKNRNRVAFAKELAEVHGLKGIEFYPKYQLGGCSATSNSAFIVGPQGELYKCWVDVGKPDRVVGSITDEKINLSLISEYIVGTDMFNDTKCLSCFLLPVCDGGCALFRLEYKLTGKKYNVCPIEHDEMVLLLDTVYEQILKKNNTK